MLSLFQAKRGSELPPDRPTLPIDRDYELGLRWSLLVHVGIIAVVLIKSLVFPNEPKLYIPSLRVDIVGLPDLLKNEKKMIPQGKSLDDIQKILEKAQRDADRLKKIPPPKPVKVKEPPVEKAAPDEMVLKPKQVPPKNEKAEERRLKAAMDRIKALSKIDAERDNSDDDTPKSAPLIKGNKISKGSSQDGDAKESNDTNYYDSVRSKLQENWALPIWLSRQNLSAQIQITIDGRGRVRDFRFVKPSGNPQFDDAVKRTLAESQPFPTPPSDLLMNGILIGFPL
jgi:TonB family protein